MVVAKSLDKSATCRPERHKPDFATAMNLIIFPLDLFPFPPIIGRNIQPMNPSLFSLSLIVVVLVVLIIKGQFSVRMATVRTK